MPKIKQHFLTNKLAINQVKVTDFLVNINDILKNTICCKCKPFNYFYYTKITNNKMLFLVEWDIALSIYFKKPYKYFYNMQYDSILLNSNLQEYTDNLLNNNGENYEN